MGSDSIDLSIGHQSSLTTAVPQTPQRHAGNGEAVIRLPDCGGNTRITDKRFALSGMTMENSLADANFISGCGFALHCVHKMNVST
jgi:hypothetical protein